MKVHRDDHPEILTLAEIKTQIALGLLTKRDLWRIVDTYSKSKYYLSEEVLIFLEKYLGTVIQGKNKFYFRDKNQNDKFYFE